MRLNKFLYLLLSHSFQITAISRFMDKNDEQYQKMSGIDVTISDVATRHIACFDLQWMFKDLLLQQSVPHTRVNGHLGDYDLNHNTCYVAYLSDVGHETHAYLVVCDLPHVIVINLYGGSCRVHYRFHTLERFLELTSKLYVYHVENKKIVQEIFGFDPVHDSYLISRSEDDYYIFFDISDINVNHFVNYILYLKKNILNNNSLGNSIDSLIDMIKIYNQPALGASLVS